MADPVLEFEDVAVPGGHPYDTALWQISFQLLQGQLMLVHLEAEQTRLPLADAAQGLVEPEAGCVQFLGQNWRELSQMAAAEARARIGRVFNDPGWLSELDIDDNIVLAQLHHTSRPESEIRDEAAELARAYSLPGLPKGRSSNVRRQDLRRAACVRAFLGKPALLILEEPTAGVYSEIMPALMTSVRSARAGARRLSG